MNYQRIILIDFDGVIHYYRDGWKGPTEIYDDPVPGAFDFLVELVRDDRFDPQIYSSRSKLEGGIDAMQRWMHKHGLDSEAIAEIKFPTTKPAAWLTIDDRAICFRGTWPTPDYLLNYQPWNKSPFYIELAEGNREAVSDGDFLLGLSNANTINSGDRARLKAIAAEFNLRHIGR